MLRFQCYYFQLKNGNLGFGKTFSFWENLFHGQNIEIVQNFQRVSRKSMPISQMEGYFENR